MAEFPAATLSPAKVHENSRALSGHHPHWIRPVYQGGLFFIEHYRTCSYCGSIHPGDMMLLLRAGRSMLEPSGKILKRILMTPNPVGGELVKMGSIPGPVFGERGPRSLKEKLIAEPADPALMPSIGERLAGHYERPAMAEAPAMIAQPFYLEHTTDAQWDEICAAASEGERNAYLHRP